jgi:hypothetical protein
MTEPDDRASLDSLFRFLLTCPPERVIGGEYRVIDLVSDLYAMAKAEKLVPLN